MPMDDNGPLQVRRSRKIARHEWAAIKSRHATGESLASIARAYRCTAPAIRYIIRQDGELARLASPSSAGERPPPTQQPEDHSAGRKPVAAASGNQAARFDPQLRETMAMQISHFLVAFDAVLAAPDPANCDKLRDAVDRLMRAAARVRIELETASAW